jgi:phage tail-like protein
MAIQTFWPLDGPTGWQTATAKEVSVRDAIRLTAVPHGPLALDDPADSLGGLLLPRGLAIATEKESIYLLNRTDPLQKAPNEKWGNGRCTKRWWLKQYDVDEETFNRLEMVNSYMPDTPPATDLCDAVPPTKGIGDSASATVSYYVGESYRFERMSNIAVLGRYLYLVAYKQVLIFDRYTLVLHQRWDWPNWEPIDVVVDGRYAYILDRRNGRVWRHIPKTDLDPSRDILIDKKAAADRWQRIGLDRDGRIYLLEKRFLLEADEVKTRLAIYSSQGEWLERVENADDVRQRFDKPIIWLDHKKRFTIPGVQKAFNLLNGDPVKIDPAEAVGQPPYQASGYWVGKALDSQIYQCQWHRLEVNVTALPAGAKIIVQTFTSSEKLDAATIDQQPDYLWDTNYTIIGQLQAPPQSAKPSLAEDLNPVRWHDVLVQSRQGQFLWLRVQLKSDGFDTPAVAGMRVHYPRDSYLSYLPAVFAADDESRWFLERYLSIIQREWDDLEQKIAEFGRYLDPKAVPEGAPMDFLAYWLALTLPGMWDAEQKRNLLTAVPSIYRDRGTLGALKKFIQIYLQNLTTLSPDVQGAYPQIVEGFQERQQMLLSQAQTTVIDRTGPLWGPQMVGRLQLDVYAEADKVRLVSTGDPERDIFHEYAHRFRVFVPANWIRTDMDERLLKQAIDSEKPAHTQYDLCLVEPRFRVGLQSTVGIDTIIGDYPLARLAGNEIQQTSPSRPPRHRLGYDMVLAACDDDRLDPPIIGTTRLGLGDALI